jgi:hypothetical protein
MRQLEEASASRRAMTEIREPLDELADDDDFWAEQARSLAVFAAPESLGTFRLPNRLTSEVEVGDRAARWTRRCAACCQASSSH